MINLGLIDLLLIILLLVTFFSGLRTHSMLPFALTLALVVCDRNGGLRTRFVDRHAERIRGIDSINEQLPREIVAEAMLISLAGGLVVTLLTAASVSVLARTLQLDIVVRPTTVAWALGAAALSGLLAGYYPARRATRIDVIAAVRAE